MTEAVARPSRSVWVGVLLFFTAFALAFLLWFLQTLKTFGQSHLRVIGPVTDFVLTNQANQAVSLADFSNHVWVADIIFTRCAGPCPRMTAQMSALQGLLPKDSPAKLVTLTTDPDFDTPSVLKKYGDHFSADFNRWIFLTGKKAQLASLAGDSLKLAAVPVKPEDRKDDADLFIHTTIFVLVDKHARLRASYETGGEGIDWTNAICPRLLRDLHQLVNEP